MISTCAATILPTIATGYTVPAIRRAAGMLEQGVVTGPSAVTTVPHAGDEPSEPTLEPTGTDLAVKERLDNIAGRVVGVMCLEITTEGIAAVRSQVNPDKLERATVRWAGTDHGEPLFTAF